LRAFIGTARRAHKPLSLHIRDAHDDARRILDEEQAREVGGVIHCFTGTLDDAKAYVALGFHVSFSGVVTFKSAEPVREAAAWLPLDRLLVETDCPYLAPVPLRGKRNEPAFVVHTAARLAEIKGIAPEELAQASSANTRRLFACKPSSCAEFLEERTLLTTRPRGDRNTHSFVRSLVSCRSAPEFWGRSWG